MPYARDISRVARILKGNLTVSAQKYRFDREGKPNDDGSVPVYSDWQFGPSLAGLRNCRVSWCAVSGCACGGKPRRTVYVVGEATGFDTTPAAINVKGRVVRGTLTCSENGYLFTPRMSRAGRIS